MSKEGEYSQIAGAFSFATGETRPAGSLLTFFARLHLDIFGVRTQAVSVHIGELVSRLSSEDVARTGCLFQVARATVADLLGIEGGQPTRLLGFAHSA